MPDLTPVRSEVTEFLYDHQEVKIVSQEQYMEAGDLLKQLMGKIKKLETKRLEYTRPLDESKAAIMRDYKGIVAPLEELVDRVKTEMLVWHQKEKKRLDEEQERLEREALAHAKAEGKSEVEVAIVNDVKTVRGDISTITIRKLWKFKVEDQSKIPTEFLCPDEEKIKQAIKDGKRQIPGISIYEEEQKPTIR